MPDQPPDLPKSPYFCSYLGKFTGPLLEELQAECLYDLMTASHLAFGLKPVSRQMTLGQPLHADANSKSLFSTYPHQCT
jgi:hypothetical protein